MDGRYLICSVCSVWLSGAAFGDMSQVRVTDFFSQRKKGLAGPVKAARQRDRGTWSRCAKNKELCSSSVHQEFVRVIDEAAGLHNEDSFVSNTAKNLPSSPRTPKRSSADAEFDPGAAAISATADHSTAKKRRQQVGEAEAAAPERTTRRTARKKLILPQDAPQVQQFVSVYHPPPPCFTCTCVYVCVWGVGASVYTTHVSLLMWRIELLPGRVQILVCVQ